MYKHPVSPRDSSTVLILHYATFIESFVNELTSHLNNQFSLVVIDKVPDAVFVPK